MQHILNAERTDSPLQSPRPSKLRIFASVAVLAAGLGVAITGCHGGRSPNVVATVNGKPIMRADMEMRYKETLGNSHQQPSVEQADIVKLNIVHNLIDSEILMQRAAKLHLTASDEEVQAKLDQVKAPYTPDEFNKWLNQQHMTLDKLKEEIRRNKTEEKLFNKEINSRINVTDADITSYYNTHKADFDLIEPQYHIAQIVVTSIPAPPQQAGNLQNSKAMNEAQAKRKIEMLDNRIKSGEDFGMLAANFSERPDNAQSGGDMGIVSESQLKAEPEVYGAIIQLKPGEVTPVLPLYENTPAGKKKVGYAIYKLMDKESAGQHELSDPRVQQVIRKQLHDARSQLLQNAYIEMLQDHARVVNYYAEQIFKNGVQ
ncbi:MAG TPA: SurA N-terminal domain-containing protein [Acidobacteriaceae bacterium]|nr:SurA N-terminal domain-containing protein [Acidobacteriaceae bacterium]